MKLETVVCETCGMEFTGDHFKANRDFEDERLHPCIAKAQSLTIEELEARLRAQGKL